MMHGYMAFNEGGDLLVPFRTWRNTITEQAAKELTQEFGFNIPQRWSIAHLHQAILNKEEHVKDIAFFTTLAGYIHWQLSGEKVLGVGDASGMFPIDSKTKNYNQDMLGKFKDLIKKFFVRNASACLANGQSAKEYFISLGANENNIYYK